MIFACKNLSKSYGRTKALKSVSLSLNEGEILGLIGPNGSGKTTLMKIICGLCLPNKGTYELFGKKNKRDIIPLRNEIGSIIEEPVIFKNYSVKTNLKFAGKLFGIDKADEKIKEVLDLMDLTSFVNKKARYLSLGMRQRLGLALILLKDPKFLILDEPTNGLDPLAVYDLRILLKKLNKEKGTTILIASHNLRELESLAERFVFIAEGQIKCEISSDDLSPNCDLENYYLNLMRGKSHD